MAAHFLDLERIAHAHGLPYDAEEMFRAHAQHRALHRRRLYRHLGATFLIGFCAMSIFFPWHHLSNAPDPTRLAARWLAADLAANVVLAWLVACNRQLEGDPPLATLRCPSR